MATTRKRARTLAAPINDFSELTRAEIVAMQAQLAARVKAIDDAEQLAAKQKESADRVIRIQVANKEIKTIKARINALLWNVECVIAKTKLDDNIVFRIQLSSDDNGAVAFSYDARNMWQTT
jgi:predicted ATPase